ncbi:MAG TPA: hypothetical protein VK558_07345 [Patescibacteria group bacterium]|nr:hypothetical protein [Patescibacteria group bacterium]
MAETLEEQAKRLYEQGRFQEMFSLSVAGIKASPQDVSAWLFAAVAAALLGDRQAYLHLHEQAHHVGGAIATCRNSLTFLLDHEDYDVLIATVRDIPRDNVLWIIAQYYIGCALIMKGEVQSGLGYLDQVKQSWQLYRNHIDFFGGLNVMLRQALTVAGAEDVTRRRAQPIALAPLEFVGPPLGPHGIVLTAANNLYFNALGGCFVDNMMPMLGPHGLHMHVVSPDDATRAVMADLLARYPGRVAFSLEETPPFTTTTYFACARFFAIDRAKAFHGTAEALSFDIDIAPLFLVEDFFRHGDDFDFACFRMKRNEPASFYQASIMYWGRGEETHTFLSALQAFCWPKLGENPGLTWLLDQAALFSVLESGLADLALRFGDFSRMTGKTMHGCTRPIASEEAKNALFAGQGA